MYFWLVYSENISLFSFPLHIFLNITRKSKKHIIFSFLEGIMQSGYKMYTVDEDVNIIVHMRNWSMVCFSSLAVFIRD